MKRFFRVGLLAYAALVVAVLSFCAPPEETVTVLSLREDRSRVIAGNETLGIPLFFSASDTFFTEPSLISAARIADAENELAVAVEAVEGREETVTHGGTAFRPYDFRLGFGEMEADGLAFSFREAILEITYANGEVLCTEIGNLDLRFDPVENPGHLDLVRMYALTETTPEGPVLTAVVLGLEKRVESPVTVTGISLGLSCAAADVASILTVFEPVDRDASLPALLGNPEWTTVRDELPEETGNLSVANGELWVIPVIHQSVPRVLSRFPLLITYEYLGDGYVHVVDDFLFYTPGNLPGVLLDDVCETVHRH